MADMWVTEGEYSTAFHVIWGFLTIISTISSIILYYKSTDVNC